MRCPVCGELRELVEVPAAHGEAGAVRVELYGLRLLRCADRDHPVDAAHADFAADLLSAVLVGGAVPAARTRGLLRRRPVCAGCAGDLAGIEVAAGSVRARVRIPRAAPLTVTVDGPTVECPGCHRRQLAAGPASTEQLERALRGALADSGIPGEW